MTRMNFRGLFLVIPIAGAIACGDDGSMGADTGSVSSTGTGGGTDDSVDDGGDDDGPGTTTSVGDDTTGGDATDTGMDDTAGTDDTDDTGGSEGTTGGGPPALRGVRVDMTDMTPHVNGRMEFRIVNAGDVMIFNGVLTALPGIEYDWLMPNSTPEGEGFRVDFFADFSGNGQYDAPPLDHAWSIEVPASGMEPLAFAHNMDFVDIDQPQPMPMGGDFTLDLTEFMPHVGELFEARVYMAESGRLAGRFVMTEMGGANPTVTLPGIILNGTDYQVDFFGDLNGNGVYDAPPMDHAWRVMATGGPDGLTIEFPHDEEWTDIGF